MMGSRLFPGRTGAHDSGFCTDSHQDNTEKRLTQASGIQLESSVDRNQRPRKATTLRGKEELAAHTEMRRVRRSKAQARTAYNRWSRWYDALAGSSESKYMELGLQLLAATQGERVLEIGCGTGHGVLALAQAVGPKGKVYAIDISDGMCAITRARIAAAALTPRVEIKRGDAVRLPFASDSLDAVFMSFTLELFDTPEIPRVLHECWRVLHEGGRLCVVAMSKKGKATTMVRLYEWFHDVFPSYADCRPIFVEEAVEQAGFGPLTVRNYSMWGLPLAIVLAKKSP
jgi:ubiquinone/menaquinone biosynthesis C-methylase UbiE